LPSKDKTLALDRDCYIKLLHITIISY